MDRLGQAGRPDGPASAVWTAGAASRKLVTVTATAEPSPSPAGPDRSTTPGMVSSSLVVMTAFVASKILGLLRERAIAARFGATAEADAYYAAFRVPDLLFTLIAGGALVTAFLPVFARTLYRDDSERPWRLASAVTNLALAVTVVLAGLAALLAHPLIDALFPGFEPATRRLAADLMRLLLASTLIFALSGIQMGILNAFHHFLTPAIAPALYNAGILFGAIYWTDSHGVHGLAYGVILGAFLHLAVKIPSLLAYGFKWRPVLDLGDPDLRRVLALMWPRVLGLGTFQVAFIVMARLASDLEQGSVAAFQYAWVISQLPQTLLGTAVGIVAFPTLASLAARSDTAGLRDTLVRTLRGLLTLTVPASAGLVVLSGAAVNVLLRSGAFDARAAAMTMGALQFFALGLVGHVTLEVVARAFYARQDTLTPLLVAAIAMVINIGIAMALVAQMGIAGLALSNSVAVTAEVGLLLVILHRRLPDIGARSLLDGLWRIGAATLGMVGVTLATTALVEPRIATELGPALAGVVVLTIGAAAGGLAYLAGTLVLRLEETALALALARRVLDRIAAGR